MKLLVAFVFLSIILSTGCLTSEKKYVSGDVFNVPAFIQSEQKRIENASGRQIIKTVTLDTVSESKAVSTVDLDSALNVLSIMQLDAAAYTKVWIIDTTQTEKGIAIKYRNTQNDLPIQLCTIILANNTAIYLDITATEKNLLYSTNKQYTYIPDSIFYIDIRHKTLFYPEKQISIRYDIK